MLATIRDDIMKYAQHAAHNPKFERRDYSNIPGGGLEKIKGPAHMVEGGHHPRKAHNLTHMAFTESMHLKNTLFISIVTLPFCIVTFDLYTFNNIMMKIEINSRYEYIGLAVNNIDKTIPLTHWGRTMHICVGKVTTIGSDNGLSPGRRQAIIWTIAITLLIGPLGTNFSEILIRIQTFSFKKMHLKMSSAKWCPFVSASMC